MPLVRPTAPLGFAEQDAPPRKGDVALAEFLFEQLVFDARVFEDVLLMVVEVDDPDHDRSDFS